MPIFAIREKITVSELLTWRRLDCRDFNSYLISANVGYKSRRDNTLLIAKVTLLRSPIQCVHKNAGYFQLRNGK
jgi:hypothetical protein